MRNFKLSVSQYREKLEQQFGFASEILVKEYAEARTKYKRSLMDLEYNEGVLERMKKQGCKPCEIAAQKRHLEKLKADKA